LTIFSPSSKPSLKQLINIVKKWLIRGPIRKWLILRRARQIDEAYLRQIVKPLAVQAKQVSPPAILGLNQRLSRILYIGDCMWEQEQLFPEIRFICYL
jgi:hypothetical protein